VRYLPSLGRFAKKSKKRGGEVGEDQIQRAQVEVEKIMQGQFQTDLLIKESLTGRLTCSFDCTELQKSKLFMYIICIVDSYAYV